MPAAVLVAHKIDRPRSQLACACTLPLPLPLRYEVNFEPHSGILNDLYQGYVRTPPGQWSTVSLPLNRLLLTGQGQIRDIQRKWDTGVELMSLGFTIADGVGGPFRLDVAWVALVPKVREGCFRSGGEDGQGEGKT